MEIEVPQDTQQWIILAVIVQIVCSTIVSVVGLVTQKKVDENTAITKKIGEEVKEAASEVKAQTEETARQVQELQSDSGLLKKKGHIHGDKEKPAT